MLAEDDVTIRNLLGTMLTEQGYAVLAAADGGEALEICQKFTDPIHLLITDIQMPRMDGLTLARQVYLARSDIKIILMSAFISEVISSDNRRDAFLQKPFQPATVSAVASQALFFERTAKRRERRVTA